jgi:2-polyprenyl-3-methyl-5-hydroxy-6-metoxy-1,4-benzoquinol methylase
VSPPSPDPLFAEPRLAAIYDALEAERADLDVYAALVEELGARSVLDVGCGTGTFACRLARAGLDVAAVDPAAASLAIGRTKPGARTGCAGSSAAPAPSRSSRSTWRP